MSAGVRNVTFQDITVNGSDNGIRIKSQRGRGGIVQDITYSNIQLYNVKNAIYLTLNYNKNVDPTNATATPIFNNIVIKDVVSNHATNGWILDGLPESYIRNASFSNINFVNTKKLVETCDYIYGSCASVLPSCPPCLQ
jgi:polygalacturonase